MNAPASSHTPRLTAVMREGERVTSLELFFDLVFVLALTQCTALMSALPTWGGLVKGLLVLGVLWWSWGGYAWLTSVVDPEEGSVRLVMLAAMAALLVAALCVPGAFAGDALLFACAYGVVRAAHIGLFLLASRDDPALRSSVLGLAVSTAIGVALLFAAALAADGLRLGLWGLALLLDMGGPFLFGAEGWKLVPGHFAERHGAIVIIALGESIVAIGAGASGTVGAGVVAAAVLGMIVVGTLWWLYFDIVAIVAERRLSKATEGRERNEIARDSYSYLHFPMIAGIELVALGMKRPSLTSAIRSVWSRPARCSAAAHCICSLTSLSVGATSTASTRNASFVPLYCSRCSGSRRRSSHPRSRRLRPLRRCSAG